MDNLLARNILLKDIVFAASILDVDTLKETRERVINEILPFRIKTKLLDTIDLCLERIG